MENQTKYLFYGLSRNSQNPLDPRQKISSLNNINDELSINYRYNGLIFYVEDINKLYVFLNDLQNPIDLQTLLTNGQINGVFSNDYITLITSLNNTNPTIGSLVTVFPLSVTFLFNGTTWEYFNGIYKVLNDTELNSIPIVLRKVNKDILMGSTNPVKYIFKTDLTKSTEIIETTSIPIASQIENNRYYSINGILYISLNSKLYKLSENFYFDINKNLIVGDNQINHNLNSTYIRGLIWINNSITNELFELKIKIVDLNNCIIPSQLNITGKLLLTSNF